MGRTTALMLVVGALAIVPISPQAVAAQGPHDFDFLIGSWSVHNRRLDKILSGSTQWYEFDGHAVVHPLEHATGNLEEWTGVSPKNAIDGVNIRVYNPTAQEWSTLWINGRVGTIDRPLIGKFHDGKGEFYDQETFDGRTIFARYLWFVLSPTSARWEQAFSVDFGKTWETNWIIEYTRAKA